jgi:CelD/BcsL family acetyltransferase involved in cellulose biosynthesis
MLGRAMPDSTGDIEVLQEFPPPDGVVDRWRELAVERESIFATPEWYGAWLEAKPDDRPFILVWRDRDIRGLLPLVHSNEGRGLLRPAGAAYADWFTPVCAERDEQELAAACARALAARHGDWKTLRLDRVLTSSAWPDALANGSPRRGAVAEPLEPPRPLPYVELAGGYDGWLASRSRNFRSQLGGRRRRLEREHDVVFRLAAVPERVGEDFATFTRLHDARWAGRGKPGGLMTVNAALQSALVRPAFEQGWLRLWTMELDGEPAAAWYGWRVGTRYLYYLSGFDPGRSDASVGTVMLAHTIAEAAGEGAHVYDLLLGDEAYKRRFETGRRTARSYTIGARLGTARLRARGEYWARGMVRWIRQRRARSR